MVRRERSRGRVLARVRSVASPIVPWGAGESRLHRQPYGAPADRGRRGATVWGRSGFSEVLLSNIDFSEPEDHALAMALLSTRQVVRRVVLLVAPPISESPSPRH